MCIYAIELLQFPGPGFSWRVFEMVLALKVFIPVIYMMKIKAKYCIVTRNA